MKDFTSMSFFSSYGNLKTVNGYTTTTFHEACKLMHLLEDDTEWDSVLSEASTFQMPREHYVVSILQYAAGVSQRMNGERRQKFRETNWRWCSGCSADFKS